MSVYALKPEDGISTDITKAPVHHNPPKAVWLDSIVKAELLLKALILPTQTDRRR